MASRQSQPLLERSEPRPVKVIEHDWIELDDGISLAVRIWLPQDADSRPVPAVIDSVPYRHSDGTAIWDAGWGTYFAARGFAFVRPDLRGSGDSGGIMDDEYTEREQRDCEQVIAWLAQREWCTGAVGMIGVSWGAFAALQMAARAPEPLRGVVAIHGSDDRYADDVHYLGGCVAAMEMSQWATSMLAYLNQPPDPAAVGHRWRQQWLQRLGGATPWITHWLGHQRRDEYWRQGSACEDYASIRCPVLAVGGWSDGYRDMVLRIVEHVEAPVRGLIGPWGHTSPEHGAPAPAIGFLQECMRFFDASLNGADNGFFDEPTLVSWMQEPVAPAGGYAQRPGRWVADPSWPSPNVNEWLHELGTEGLGGAAGLQELRSPAAATPTAPRSLRGLQATGIDGGVWCGDGGPADFALDQRPDDGASLCWDTEPLGERVELLGRAEARLQLSVDRPQALVAVRVCDVAPDGTSTLVARGLLNLSRRQGHDHSVPMGIGAPTPVTIAMQSTAYAIPAGHRVRLAVSPTYWPWAWPSPEAVTLTVHGGALALPRRTPGPLDDQMPPFGPPESGEPLASEQTMLRPPGRRAHRDLATGEVQLEFDWHGSRTRIVATDTEMGEENVTTYRIVEGDPLSATVDCRVTTTLRRRGWSTEVRAASTMTCDSDTFTVTTTLDAFDDGVRIHAAAHVHTFPRDGV
ncbi:MAG: CocE/NonD family hydrolase [Solirubrobacteraceae bacterium]